MLGRGKPLLSEIVRVGDVLGSKGGGGTGYPPGEDPTELGGYDTDWGMGNEVDSGEGELGENGPDTDRAREWVEE